MPNSEEIKTLRKIAINQNYPRASWVTSSISSSSSHNAADNLLFLKLKQ